MSFSIGINIYWQRIPDCLTISDANSNRTNSDIELACRIYQFK